MRPRSPSSRCCRHGSPARSFPTMCRRRRRPPKNRSRSCAIASTWGRAAPAVRHRAARRGRQVRHRKTRNGIRTRDLCDRACIVGVGQTDYSKASGRSVQALALQAARAGHRRRWAQPPDIDAILPYVLGPTSDEMASQLGISNCAIHRSSSGPRHLCRLSRNRCAAHPQQHRPQRAGVLLPQRSLRRPRHRARQHHPGTGLPPRLRVSVRLSCPASGTP